MSKHGHLVITVENMILKNTERLKVCNTSFVLYRHIPYTDIVVFLCFCRIYHILFYVLFFDTKIKYKYSRYLMDIQPLKKRQFPVINQHKLTVHQKKFY